LEERIREAAEVVAGSRQGMAFTGAGISTESGLPDFRGPSGLWRRYDPSLFTLHRYVRDPEVRKAVWRFRAELLEAEVRPNPAHLALARLEEMGILRWVVTQNIDDLHRAAGSRNVIELHGSKREVVCLSCGARGPAEEAVARFLAGEEDPACPHCGGILKLTAVMFGEPLPTDALDAAFRAAREADLCLVIGSSLQVYPAAEVPFRAATSGAALIVVNDEPTPLDHLARVVLRGRAGEILPKLVEEVEKRLGRAS
jgi:NAD-dependent deacetylase